MKVSPSSLDWSLIQAFLAVAEHGSLSAAARAADVSQPTLGRHIRQAEEALGLVLFRRVTRGLELTEAGLRLLPAARQMQHAAGQLSLAAAGSDEALAGDVRLTASMVISHFILPPILAGLRRDAPGIRIDLVPSDQTENLLFREADIALRMFRPTQLDVITKHIADMPIGMFAATSYLDRVGRPETLEDMLALDFLGYDHDDRIIRGLAMMDIAVTREFFVARCDDQAAFWHLVRAGCGIGPAPLAIGRNDPAVEPLFPELPIPSLPIWLTAHEAMRHTPRLHRVWKALAAAIPKAVS
jgi:DNA-binding transcriptional LysR family regulator